MEFLLSLHNLFRWVVLALGFLAVLGALKNNAKPLRIYAIFITLQFLLGLALWLNFLYLYVFKTKEFLVRFFVLEHPILDIFTYSPCKVKEGWKFVEDPDRNFYDLANSRNTLVEAPNKVIAGSLF
jgi:hypothetical protein